MFSRLVTKCAVVAVSIVVQQTTLALAQCRELPYPPNADDVEAFLAHKFDYVVIGGGTAGMALGARLSENPDVVVGVLEAGRFHNDDPLISVPGLAGAAWGNPLYDWDFATNPQVGLGGRNVSLPRGKMLGGSSGINLLALCRASMPEYDAWSNISGSAQWSWNGLLPYFKKSETMALSSGNPYPGISPSQAKSASLELPFDDGLVGPINVSHNAFYFDVVSTVVETFNTLGVPTNPIPENGTTYGLSNVYSSIDRRRGTRSYSPTGYFCPNENRTNLRVLTGAQVTRVIIKESSSGFDATAVEFVVNSTRHSVNATREVILSAGAVQTPQILELSGIGNSSILKEHDITPLVDLPGVGENFQEHLFVNVQFLLKPGHETFDSLRLNATFAEEQMALYNATGTGLYAATDSTTIFLPFQDLMNSTSFSELLETFDRDTQSVRLSSIESIQYPIQHTWLTEGVVPHIEIIQVNSGLVNLQDNSSYINFLAGNLHPVSRGSVHIESSNPLNAPIIDPQFLSKDYDSLALLNILKYLQNLGNYPPFSEIVAGQTNPDPTQQTDEELIAYIQTDASTGDHLIGTAALAPREVGGVVGPDLKVYGTKNLRVIDASIFPLHIATHTQHTVYAVAEAAADLILATFHESHA